MTKRTIPYAVIFVLCCPIAGCPAFGGDTSDPDGGAAGAPSAADLAKIEADAVAKQYPPAPDLKTLCSLDFQNTDLGEAEALFGKNPQDIEMDAMHATLSYRFRPDDNAPDAGAAIITLYMTFNWHDGAPGLGTILTGIGAHKNSTHKGYLLDQATLMGLPYPGCWPHMEPS